VGQVEEENGLLYLLQQDSSTESTLMALHASNGAVAWSYKTSAFRYPAGVSSDYPDIRAMLSNGVLILTPFSSLNVETPNVVYALRASDGRLLWHATHPAGSLIVQNNALYLAQSNGQIDAWRVSDDHHLWHTQGPTAKGLFPPWLADPSLLLLRYRSAASADLVIIRASDGKLLWHYTGI
jgi:outer membrane protein assembly factor BamB